MSVDGKNSRKFSIKPVVSFALVTAALLLQTATLASAAAPTEKIVTVRRLDGLIPLHDGKGQIKRSRDGEYAWRVK